MRQLRANGVDLSYIEQGTGAPVVFVHGAWMDLRRLGNAKALCMGLTRRRFSGGMHLSTPSPSVAGGCQAGRC